MLTEGDRGEVAKVAGMVSAGPKVLSPSRIARFYFHECERFLRYAATPSASRADEGVPRPPVETRPVTRAILESGYRWEEQVITDLLDDRVHIGDGEDGSDLSERIILPEEARWLLCSIQPAETIYQPVLEVPPGFYERYGHDPALISWSTCRPDLIEAVEAPDGVIELRVIDIKASPGVKLSHRIQATLYSLILASLLSDWGVTDRRVASEAGVWLAQQAAPEYSELRGLTPPIEQFLTHELPALLAAPAAEAPWHLYFRCEWCEWFDTCRSEMRTEDSVSRVAYLSTHAKRFLGSLAPAVDSVPDFGRLLEDEARSRYLDNCASLRGQRQRLRSQVEALSAETVINYGGSSLAMPRRENVRLILTTQTEPVSGQLYAFGLYAQGLLDVLGQRTVIAVNVAPAGDQEAVAALERELVTELHRILGAVDTFNAATADWATQKALQAYVFDTYERDLLLDTLMRRLADPVVAEQALQLLFHFQGPDLMAAEEHPAGTVFFPVVVLNRVLREQLALPAEVAYRFEDAVRLMAPSERAFKYNDSPYFSFELSNQLRSDAIYAVWYEGKADRIDAIRKELKIRLYATNSAINGTRERLDGDGTLFAYPPRHRLAGSLGFGSPLLSRLAFLTRYEAVLGCVETRERRTRPRAEQVAAGDVIVLRHLDGGSFEVLECAEDLELDSDPFPQYLLAGDDETGRRALLAYDDWFNRERVWVPKHAALYVAGIRDVHVERRRVVGLDLSSGAASPALVPGGCYLLCGRFTDFNGRHVLTELTELDERPGNPFEQLLTRPAAFAAPTGIEPAIRADAFDLAERHGMTASQLAGFAGVLDRRLELIWGPPGTGKTHFLGLALLCLAEAHRRHGRTVRVVVTAFTHAAIENVLRKVAELQAERKIVAEALAVGKLDAIRHAALDGTDEVAKESGDAWLASRPLAILGGTVWAARKLQPGCADIVVIDEASQLRVPEAAIAARRLSSGGRLVVAGDDRQLPPIIQGVYPEPAGGEPLLHRSLFECLRSSSGSEAITTTLLDNFRMNATLCRFPAEQVYVPEYLPATDQIAARRIELAGRSHGWLEDVLDPAHPLVVCVLDGVKATAENEIEASLAAEVALALRERLLDSDGRPYDDDTRFWRDGLFVVSPHHAQINAIQRGLAARREWDCRPFVDTVDKMQGQECDAVIVSYGVSDVEYALEEKEFIYSLNRLNVAITRGRAKTICFLPRPLLEPPVAAFDDDTIAEGIAFMQGLWRFAEIHGDPVVVPLESGAKLSIHRVGELV